ncbi:unnamed protein product [Amoebophrya sp. A25]|nr:unnamed protein product [Amoebophrya sp. A25]|eukprot:GSA25T00022531001.1
MSGTVNSRFPIRSTISPDGKVVVSGCESGRVFVFSSATGKTVEVWQAALGVQLSSPVVDSRWSKTHHFLAFAAFGEEEPPILVFRHVNQAGDSEPMRSLGRDVSSQGRASRVAGPMGGADPSPGLMGYDKKNDLKAQIMAQVKDGRRQVQMMDSITRRSG